jgi:CO/xanthine dehydrogenase FAD-binding subunit
VPRSSDRVGVFEPKTIQELLSFYADHPKATIVAGGTWLLNRQRETRVPKLGSHIISLGRVDELKRIGRSERYIDIGAAAPMSTVIGVGARVVPDILLDAIRSISYRPIRNLATLGGNICVPEIRLTAFPVLLLLESKVELRKANRSRWIPLSRFVHADGTLVLEAGELCTRIRVPRGEWNIQVYRTITPLNRPNDWSMSFAATADTTKGQLADLRFVFGAMGKTVVRSREIEAELTSRKLPLPERDRSLAVQRLSLTIDSITPALSDARRKTAIRYLDWFLQRLSTD